VCHLGVFFVVGWSIHSTLSYHFFCYTLS